MRDPKRIKKFCDELAEIWETECPDWRFGQLIVNVLRANRTDDPFFLEDDVFMQYIKDFFERK